MVTVGMNYTVLPGKEATFEEKFAAVLTAMGGVDGHVETHLYRDVALGQSYLVVSEWASRQQFGAFIASDAFRKVTDWGKSEVLAGRPVHKVYDRSESLDRPGAGAGH